VVAKLKFKNSATAAHWLSTASEPDLIFAAKAGDQEAFMELCHRCGGVLKRKIWQIVRNEADTEDALQETFLSAYRHLSEFRSDSRFQTWMTRIAINTALMVLRKRRIRSETSLEIVGDRSDAAEVWEIPDLSLNPEELCLQTQMSQIVRKAVNRLPDRFRLIVAAWYEGDDASLTNVAQSLGMTEGAAKSRLCRARARIRRGLQNQVAFRCSECALRDASGQLH
jgi:RNA polymerase sigma-70 factor, ECF subfamily